MAQPRIFLFRRQKLVLALLQAFGGRLSNIDLQKYLFLLTQTYDLGKSYEFVPYKFGCFSFQSYADRRRLIGIGAIVDEEGYWRLTSVDADYISQIDTSDQEKIISFVNKFRRLKGDSLVRHVYRNFPYFAINSEKAAYLMNREELAKIDNARPKSDGYRLFTIGYEGNSFENYLNRLIQNNVRILCDVRRNPFSRSYGFSQSTLSDTLNKLNIEYLHFPELGIDSKKRKNLRSMQDYEHLFDDYEATTLKQNSHAIDMLNQVFRSYKRIAITCFEADATMCHRSCVATALSKLPDWQYEIKHI